MPGMIAVVIGSENRRPIKPGCLFLWPSARGQGCFFKTLPGLRFPKSASKGTQQHWMGFTAAPANLLELCSSSD